MSWRFFLKKHGNPAECYRVNMKILQNATCYMAIAGLQTCYMVLLQGRMLHQPLLQSVTSDHPFCDHLWSGLWVACFCDSWQAKSYHHSLVWLILRKKSLVMFCSCVCQAAKSVEKLYGALPHVFGRPFYKNASQLLNEADKHTAEISMGVLSGTQQRHVILL